MAAAFFCIPSLIIQLGDARFGLLSLLWVLVSYFNMFDLGIGRSLTHAISVNLSKKNGKELGNILKTGIVAILVLGVVGSLTLAILVFFGVPLIKFVADPLEAKRASLLMATAIPAIILTSGFRGILEAFHEFKIINLIRIPAGLWTFLSPLLAINYWKNDLIIVSAVLVAGRYLVCFVHGYYVNRLVSKYKIEVETSSISIKSAKILFKTGGWITISNLIAAFMGYVDRFMIGGILSASAVAYYVSPQELVTKLWIIPGSITMVLFPTLSAKIFTRSKKKEVEIFFDKSINIIILSIFPIAFTIGIFSKEILYFWINQNFAEQGALIMQIFVLGVVINSIAQVPFTLIQSAGHSKLITIIYLIQFPFFIITLYTLTKLYGIEGASLAWLFRIIVDAIMMFYTIRFLPINFKKNKQFKMLILKIALIILTFYSLCNASLIFKLLAVFVLALTSIFLIFMIKAYKLPKIHS
jgi:O-antigen/teichoic acid export membrane protein